MDQPAQTTDAPDNVAVTMGQPVEADVSSNKAAPTNTAGNTAISQPWWSKKDFLLKAGVAGLVIIGVLIPTIIFSTDSSDKSDEPDAAVKSEPVEPVIKSIFLDQDDNYCAKAKLEFENKDCVHTPGPQAGANVTKGYKGGMEVDFEPNTKNYWQSSMCPVNVHWHLGAEHYSVGEYDENGAGPASTPELYESDGRPVRSGFRCHHYDADDSRFNTEYKWEHCIGMQVGETYEVHWPHSAAGACGTVNQYQTPFYDGVFCNLDLDTFSTLGPQDIANAVGVQAQVFTIVNDERYFYPNLMRSWIVDGDFGTDVAYYTGSTTGTSRNNDICSSYTPITWQVDRKCHLISASSFDKLCADMSMQRDDMSKDLYAHGSRELVADELVANNQQRRLQEEAKNFQGKYDADNRGHGHLRDGHGHGGHHDHDHHHHKWF